MVTEKDQSKCKEDLQYVHIQKIVTGYKYPTTSYTVVTRQKILTTKQQLYNWEKNNFMSKNLIAGGKT